MKFSWYRLVSSIILLTLLFQGSLPSQAANNIREPDTSKTTLPQSVPTTFSCTSVTEIPQVECQTLVALYNQTNGPNWINHASWLVTSTPCSWYGVSCSNGYVNTIGLDNNQLTGNIPPELGSLAHLQYLNLYGNQIGGSISSQLGNLSNLMRLWLGHNHLTGNIPSQLGNLSKLQYLILSSNQLSGSIPPELSDLTNLLYLDLTSNQLTGNIPSGLGNLSNLIELQLENNKLTGNIPWQLSNLPNLITLRLTSNQLTGSIPPQLGSLTYLRTMALDNNQLSGSIPLQLGNLTKLQYLYLEGNNLSGRIPPELGNLVNILWLILYDNQLSGSIPSELGKLINVEDLELGGNQINGNIPPQLGNLANLTFLDLGYNQLSGNIPPQLGNLTNLIYLSLDGNHISGSIPAQLGNLANLEFMILDDNQLNGGMPIELGNLVKLIQLDISTNFQLNGAFPTNYTNLAQLKMLHFNNTDLCIPENQAFQDWLYNIPDLKSSGIMCSVGPKLNASTSHEPADGQSSVSIKLINVPYNRQVRLMSSRGALDQFQPPSGFTNTSGQFVATLRSTTPGTAILTAIDLDTGQTFPASTSVNFTPVDVSTPPPPPTMGSIIITGVKPHYPLDGRYLQGIPVPNLISVNVDWRGATPGRVVFILNGNSHSEPANANGASHTFDMGRELGTWQNNIRIVAYDVSGKASSPVDFSPMSIPAPVWLTGLQQLGAIAPMLLGGSSQANYEYDSKIKIPPNEINLGAPGFGPSGSSTNLGFYIGGNIKLPLTCNSPVEVNAEAGTNLNIDLVGVEVGGELKGSGGLSASSIHCQLQVPQGNIQVEITVYGQKDWQVLPFVINFIAPGAGQVLQASVPRNVLSILGEIYLQANLKGGYSSDVQLSSSSPYLNWEDVAVSVGPGLETGYQFKKLGIELRLYLGAGGSAVYSSPHPLQSISDLRFNHVNLTGEAGYTLKISWWEKQQKFTIGWRYPPGTFSSFQTVDGENAGWFFVPHPRSPDYATFLAQTGSEQAFALPRSDIKTVDVASSSTITNVLVSNAYTYTEPSLTVNLIDDNAVLAWVHDDIDKPVGQSQEIEYSLWNSSSWSTPLGVTNDHFLDAAPQVEWAGDGKAVVVWERLPEVQPITATWDITTAQKIEIATAGYNPVSGIWSPVTLLTQNTALDMIPQLARNPSGSLLAAWRQNSAGQLMGDSTHPDHIMTAFYSSGAWNTPVPAVAAVPGLVDLATGYGNGEATIAFTRYLTPTGSITPTLQLFTTRWNDSTWETPIQRTNDSLGHRAPQVVYNASNQPLVVWLAGDELRLQNLVTSSSSSLTLPGEIGSIDQFRIVRGASGNIAAVFTAQAGQRDLYLAFYDQAHALWGSLRRLTDNPAAENYPAPALDISGRLLVGYASQAVFSVQHTTIISGQAVTYTLPTDGPTDLITLAHTFDQNLTMQGLAVSNDHPVPGSSMVITATFENTGDYPLDIVAVGFYDGDPSVGGVLIAKPSRPGSLAAGSSVTLSTNYLVPNSGVHTLFAVVDPDHIISETNENDNTASLSPFGPDLAIDSAWVDYWGGSDVGLQAIVRNIGSSPTPTTTLEFYNQSITGTLVASQTLPTLQAGAAITLTAPWSFGSLAGGSYTLAVLARHDTFTDILPANNSYTFTLDVLPDLMVSPYYLWTTPLNGTNVTITTTVYNLGPIGTNNVVVGFYKNWSMTDASLIFTQTISYLSPASAVTISRNVKGPLPGGIYVYVNLQRSIAETSYANNLASVLSPWKRLYLPKISK